MGVSEIQKQGAGGLLSPQRLLCCWLVGRSAKPVEQCRRMPCCSSRLGRTTSAAPSECSFFIERVQHFHPVPRSVCAAVIRTGSGDLGWGKWRKGRGRGRMIDSTCTPCRSPAKTPEGGQVVNGPPSPGFESGGVVPTQPRPRKSFLPIPGPGPSLQAAFWKCPETFLREKPMMSVSGNTLFTPSRLFARLLRTRRSESADTWSSATESASAKSSGRTLHVLFPSPCAPRGSPTARQIPKCLGR